MFGSQSKLSFNATMLIYPILSVLAAFYDTLIMSLNNGTGAHLFILPTAIWLLTSHSVKITLRLTLIICTFILLWALNLLDLKLGLVSFGLMLIIIFPLAKMLPSKGALSLNNSSLQILKTFIFICLHFGFLNYVLDTLNQYTPNEVQLIIIGNFALGVLFVWCFQIQNNLEQNHKGPLFTRKHSLSLALVLWCIGCSGLVVFFADYIRFLAILSILLGLWFCHKHRWWGCAGFVIICNCVLLIFIAKIILQYDPSLPIPQKDYLLNDTASMTSHFELYARVSLGFTLYEAAWFLLTFNTIALLVNSMIYELDEAQSNLIMAQSELSKTNANLREVNSNIRTVNRFIVNAQENERQQLAKDIDTSLNEHIKTIDSAISIIESESVNSTNLDIFTKLKTYSGHIHRSLHEIVYKLKPHMLTREGLCNTLAGDFFKDKLALFDIEYSFTHAPEIIEIPDNIGIAIYRVVQEAVNNTIKYAQASRFTVELKTNAQQISIVISDDGVGFNPSTKQRGFGLDGMHQRIHALDGTIFIQSDSGTQIQITIPL